MLKQKKGAAEGRLPLAIDTRAIQIPEGQARIILRQSYVNAMASALGWWTTTILRNLNK